MFIYVSLNVGKYGVGAAHHAAPYDDFLRIIRVDQSNRSRGPNLQTILANLACNLVACIRQFKKDLEIDVLQRGQFAASEA